MSDRAAWVVLGLVFLDEVLAVLALGVTWGLLVAVAGVALWWLFASPRAPLGGAVLRPLVKVVVFGAACLGLWREGLPVLAGALLVFSVAVSAAAQAPSVRAALGRAASGSPRQTSLGQGPSVPPPAAEPPAG